MFYFVLFSIFQSCRKNELGFKWGYRVCLKDESECLDYSALFKDKYSCISYITTQGFRCVNMEQLKKLKNDEPVCWKSESHLSRSECNQI